MKRILALILVLSMVFVLAACGKDEEGTPTGENTGATTNPTESTAATTCQHTWGDWRTETEALVGKAGTEKRTCSTCAASETQETSKNAAINSFDDWLLGSFYDAASSHDMWIGENLVETNMVNTYIDYIFFHENEGSETTVSVSQYLEKAKVYFSMSEEALDRLVYGHGETVEIGFQNPSYSIYDFVGYKHDGDSTYTIYYEKPYGDTCYFEVKLEYNLLNDKPNRYISIVRTTSLPSDLTK